jgi:hypothetical protein
MAKSHLPTQRQRILAGSGGRQNGVDLAGRNLP